jgi:hypothetical protein
MLLVACCSVPRSSRCFFMRFARSAVLAARGQPAGWHVAGLTRGQRCWAADRPRRARHPSISAQGGAGGGRVCRGFLPVRSVHSLDGRAGGGAARGAGGAWWVGGRVHRRPEGRRQARGGLQAATRATCILRQGSSRCFFCPAMQLSSAHNLGLSTVRWPRGWAAHGAAAPDAHPRATCDPPPAIPLRS